MFDLYSKQAKALVPRLPGAGCRVRVGMYLRTGSRERADPWPHVPFENIIGITFNLSLSPQFFYLFPHFL